MRDTRGTLEGPIIANLPALSQPRAFRLCAQAGALQLSIAGGPYVPLSVGGAASGWTDAGVVVTLTTPSDSVSASSDGAAPFGGNKVRFQHKPLNGNTVLEIQADGDVSGSRCVDYRRPRSSDLLAFSDLGVCTYVVSGRVGDNVASSQTIHLAVIDQTAPFPGVATWLSLIGDPVSGDQFENTILAQNNSIDLTTISTAAGGVFDQNYICSDGFAGPDEGGSFNISPGFGGGDLGVPAGRVAILFNDPAPPAGRDSPIMEFRGANSAGAAFMAINMVASPIDPRQRLIIGDQNNVLVLSFERDDVNRVVDTSWDEGAGPYRVISNLGNLMLTLDGAGGRVSFLAGAGAAATARPGAITDNGGGAISNAVAAVGDTSSSNEGPLLNDIHATMLDRINALELKIVNLGLFT